MATVNRRSVMTLFTSPDSPDCHRTRIVLAEKELTAEIIDLSEQEPPEDFHDLSPEGSVPVLADRDLVLTNARVIMEYLDERFPHPPLLPVYPVARALSRLWVRRIQRDWCDDLDILVAGKGGEAKLTKARKSLRESLIAVAPIFAEKPFFMSDDFTLVDCIVAPVLWRLEMVGIDLPEKQARALKKYSERLFERDGFQASLTEHEQEMRD
jgi:RNA polymerase-associated protein